MRPMRWMLAFGTMWTLACALGTDEPVDIASEPSAEEPEVVEPTPRERPGKRGKRHAANAEAADAPTDDGSAAASTPSASSEGPPAGIVALGGNKWSVKRSLVKKWEDHPRKFAKVAEKGKGWALKGVDTRDARHLGFRNGDVVLSVNGHPLATEAQAAAAYGLVRNKKQIVVKFKRDGNKRTHTLQIKD